MYTDCVKSVESNGNALSVQRPLVSHNRVSSRYKDDNHRKHKTEKRRSCDVIQESAGTTVSQKDTVARMTGHSNCVLIDFHFADSRGVVRQLQKRLPVP